MICLPKIRSMSCGHAHRGAGRASAGVALSAVGVLARDAGASHRQHGQRAGTQENQKSPPGSPGGARRLVAVSKSAARCWMRRHFGSAPPIGSGARKRESSALVPGVADISAVMWPSRGQPGLNSNQRRLERPDVVEPKPTWTNVSPDLACFGANSINLRPDVGHSRIRPVLGDFDFGRLRPHLPAVLRSHRGARRGRKMGTFWRK